MAWKFTGHTSYSLNPNEPRSETYDKKDFKIVHTTFPESNLVHLIKYKKTKKGKLKLIQKKEYTDSFEDYKKVRSQIKKWQGYDTEIIYL